VANRAILRAIVPIEKLKRSRVLIVVAKATWHAIVELKKTAATSVSSVVNAATSHVTAVPKASTAQRRADDSEADRPESEKAEQATDVGA